VIFPEEERGPDILSSEPFPIVGRRKDFFQEMCSGEVRGKRRRSTPESDIEMLKQETRDRG